MQIVFERSASFLLDLRAILDMTDHGSLDDKLRNYIDICGTVLDYDFLIFVYAKVYFHSKCILSSSRI